MEHIIGEQKKTEAAPNWVAAILVVIGMIVAAAVWLQSEFGLRITRDEANELVRERFEVIDDKLGYQEQALDKIDRKLDKMREEDAE
jgi:hypothetical protein